MLTQCRRTGSPICIRKAWVRSGFRAAARARTATEIGLSSVYVVAAASSLLGQSWTPALQICSRPETCQSPRRSATDPFKVAWTDAARRERCFDCLFREISVIASSFRASYLAPPATVPATCTMIAKNFEILFATPSTEMNAVRNAEYHFQFVIRPRDVRQNSKKIKSSKGTYRLVSPFRKSLINKKKSDDVRTYPHSASPF